jgi:hypothetical protein
VASQASSAAAGGRALAMNEYSHLPARDGAEHFVAPQPPRAKGRRINRDAHRPARPATSGQTARVGDSCSGHDTHDEVATEPARGRRRGPQAAGTRHPAKGRPRIRADRRSARRERRAGRLPGRRTHLQACRTAYAERYCAALNGGWSDTELTQLDVFPAGSRRNGEEEAGEAGQGLIGCGHGYGWCTTSAMRASVAHWSGHPTPPGRRPAGPAAHRVGRG